MARWMKICIVIVLAAAIAVVVMTKEKCGTCRCGVTSPPATTPLATTQPATAPATSPPAKALPRLVDLGADRCIPCKRMAPMLKELRREYVGRLRVEFHDVWKNRAVGREYGIRVIPTQIFISADGKELWRHEGYLSKQDILAKWRELGVTFEASPKP